MNKRVVYEMKGLYRDTFRVTGYEFGTGKKSVCIVGSSRGNEVQQLYCCSRLVKKMKQLEEEGRIADGHKILILPSVNPYSMNIQKRFWSTDNTDINRMFPGYCLGETTQRIAAGRFCPPCAADGRGVQQARDGKAVWPSVCGGPQGKAL